MKYFSFLLLFIFSFIITTGLYAKNKGGIMAGFNVTNISSDEINAKAKAGFQFGIIMESYKENIGILIEPQLSWIGYSYMDQSIESSKKLIYFKLPVRFQYLTRISEMSRVSFREHY